MVQLELQQGTPEFTPIVLNDKQILEKLKDFQNVLGARILRIIDESMTERRELYDLRVARAKKIDLLEHLQGIYNTLRGNEGSEINPKQLCKDRMDILEKNLLEIDLKIDEVWSKLAPSEAEINKINDFCKLIGILIKSLTHNINYPGLN